MSNFLRIILICHLKFLLSFLQAEVTAGSINLNGKLTIEIRRPGGETVMADIVRLVEEAQTREAPVQRLADKVYSV